MLSSVYTKMLEDILTVGARVVWSGWEGLYGRPPSPERVDRHNRNAQHRTGYSRVDPRGQPWGGVVQGNLEDVSLLKIGPQASRR